MDDSLSSSLAKKTLTLSGSMKEVRSYKQVPTQIKDLLNRELCGSFARLKEAMVVNNILPRSTERPG